MTIPGLTLTPLTGKPACKNVIPVQWHGGILKGSVLVQHKGTSGISAPVTLGQLPSVTYDSATKRFQCIIKPYYHQSLYADHII